jgi:signal transduction histidine kinase
MLVLIASSWWLLQKALAPVTSLTYAAERIDISNLKERLRASGSGDELDRLTGVFNSMMDRLEKSFEQVREFTLNASHELKTPLTVMRAEIETALSDPSTPPAQREIFANQIEEIDRLASIVDSLTFLAKADADQLPLTQTSVRFDELVHESFADALLLAQPNQITVELQECDQATLSGDRYRLRQLLLNLIDNSIKYNQPGGLVRMALRNGGDSIELKISNTGPPIPPDKIPRVFDRFFRGDSAQVNTIDGCGLGLAISQWIVRVHGGSIHLFSEPNQLTTVRVVFPHLKKPPEGAGP